MRMRSSVVLYMRAKPPSEHSARPGHGAPFFNRISDTYLRYVCAWCKVVRCFIAADERLGLARAFLCNCVSTGVQAYGGQ